MFWGLIMEPQRRYTQKVKKSFHISMAALDLSTSSDEPAQVMCGFEGRNYLLCTLQKPDKLQCQLDLNFEEGDEISLAANGNCHVHLTGYLIEDLNEMSEEEEAEVHQKSKKRNSQQANGPPKKKSKVVSEEDSSSEESDSHVKALLGTSIEDDDDDESYESEEEEEEEEEEEIEEEESGDEEEEGGDEEEDEEELSNKKVSTTNGVAKGEKEKPLSQLSKKELKKLKQEQKILGDLPTKKTKSALVKHLPGGLIYEDIRLGTGPVAKTGDTLYVFYEGRLKSNGKLFDSARKGLGLNFKLGAGEVIKGWDNALVGMKVSGKRRIICPPALAYGQKGSPPVIPPNSTLIFDIYLLKIE